MSLNIDHSGRTFLVAGGAGDVGEGIVRRFLRAGATVIVPSRSAENLERLLQGVRDAPALGANAAGRLVTLEGHLGSEEQAGELRERVLEIGSLNGVVAALSGPSMKDTQSTGPLIDVAIDTWREILEHNLNVHFITAKTFIPVLGKQDSSYTFISGGGGEFVKPGDAPVSVALAGQLMLARALAQEQTGVRVKALILCSPVAARSRTEVQEAWLTADEVGVYATYLASAGAAAVDDALVRFWRRSDLDALDSVDVLS